MPKFMLRHFIFSQRSLIIEYQQYFDKSKSKYNTTWKGKKVRKMQEWNSHFSPASILLIGLVPIFTESLILAQGERWRRG